MKLKNPLALLIILSLLNSCISIKGSTFPTADSSDIKTYSKKKSKIAIDLRFTSPLTGENNSLAKKHYDLFKDVIEKSECCVVIEEANKADIKIEILFKDSLSLTDSSLAMLSIFSAFVIPSWTKIDDKLEVKIIQKEKIYTYNLEGSLTIARWLPFIFIMPFRDSPKELSAAMEQNFYKSIILQMKKDGTI